VQAIALHYPSQTKIMATKKRRSAEDDVEDAKVKKKRRVIEEDPPKKKKKKKVSEDRNLTILRNTLDVSSKKTISKLRTKGMRSIIGDSADEIQQLLEVNANESAVSLMQKRLLQTLVDILPYAEHAVRESKGQRGVYQLNSLITSLREVMTDMQSTRDKGAIGAQMVERVIRPAFLDIGMVLVQEEARLDGEIRELLGVDAFNKIRAARKDSVTRVGRAIQEKYGEAKDSAVSFLQG
jgi:hypothetical protein